MSCNIAKVVAFYVLSFILFQENMHGFIILYGKEFKKIFQIFENRAKRPNVCLRRRILGDFTRIY